MEIKLKLEEVLDVNNTLKKIIDDKNMKLNTLLKFRLLSIMKTLEPHIISFEIIKNEKIVEYGKKNKDGISEIKKEDTEALNKFRNALKPILKNQVTINLELLDPNEIFNSNLRSDYLMRLYPIIKNIKK